MLVVRLVVGAFIARWLTRTRAASPRRPPDFERPACRTGPRLRRATAWPPPLRPQPPPNCSDSSDLCAQSLPPTPDLTGRPRWSVLFRAKTNIGSPAAGGVGKCAPHGCACGDLDFYHVGGGTGTQLLNRAAFAASLTPGVPVCIVVHGSFTNWKSLCDDCVPVLRWIRSGAPQRPLHVLFYTWPSEGGITYEPHIDVGILGARASFNGVYLAELVARIPPGHPVCLVGHSHGARLVAAALHVLGGGEVDNVRLTWPAPPDLHFAVCSWPEPSTIIGSILGSGLRWPSAAPSAC